MGSRAGAQGTLGSNNQAMVELMELQRKADAGRAVYEAFLNRTQGGRRPGRHPAS